MVDSIFIPEGADKAARYEHLIPQIVSLVDTERNVVANLGNVAAAIHFTFDNLWTGFYLVEGDQLVLGPFQGPVACTRIGFGKGVCGACWQRGETIVVPDVELFPGHIACSSLSRSEIVVPGFRDGRVALVLDVDSTRLAAYDEVDARSLEQIMRLIEKCLW